MRAPRRRTRKRRHTDGRQRARIAFFVDAYISKVNPVFFGILRASDDASAEAEVGGLVQIVQKEIEPLLQNSAPFFGGSSKLTLAEVSGTPCGDGPMLMASGANG